MDEILELLEQAWNSNADKMEYMTIDDKELDRLLEVNNKISEAQALVKKFPTKAQIEEQAKTYNNELSSINESIWMSKGFVEGANWALGKTTSSS